MDKQKNLAIHRLNSWNDFAEYLETSKKTEFFAFLNSAYKLLADMHPGDIIVIEDDVSPENRKLFIKASCLFISENNSDYQFSNDYSQIERLLEKLEVSINKIMIEISQKRRKKQHELERASGADRGTAQGTKTTV